MKKKILVNLVCILIVIIIVLVLSSNKIIDKFNPIMIENQEQVTAPIIILLGENKLNINGEGSFLLTKEENKLVRILSPKDKNISYFYNEEDNKKIEKNRIFWYNESKDPKEIGYIITSPRFKPYLKLEMFAKTEKELEKVGYGIYLNNFDVYLPNGTILENDFERKEDDTFIGTNYKNDVEYEIFYNGEDAIIIAGEIEYIDNLFNWNTFKIWISKKENNIFDPLYIIYIKNANLTYENGWIIQSKQFNGNVEDYIQKVKKNLDS